MKRLTFLFLLTLVLVSCGTDGNHFKIEGRLLNLNQGEFYVYSTDGLIKGLDTIHVQAGRFTYQTKCEDAGTLVIIFPNFSEQVVFAEPGKIVELNGNAQRLKELEITGTKSNKLMTAFRENISSASPVEIKKSVRLFVNDNPESIVSIYLVNKYFLQGSEPDYAMADELLKFILKAQPKNGRLLQLSKQIEVQKTLGIGKTLPSFSVVDINGNKISSKDYLKGDAVIYLWASWEYESCNIQRVLRDRRDTSVKVLGVCLDTSLKECRSLLERDNIHTPVICDEQMFGSRLVKQLGFSSIPDNIVIKNGKIVGRNLTSQEIRDKF